MILRGAVASLVLVTGAYLAVLVWVDASSGMMRLAPGLVGVLAALICLTAISWTVRFCRWRWLMRRAGFSPRWLPAFLAYLSGFAFTATPGKVGELIRIRYFGRLGVPARLVVGLFVYERCLDVLAVLLLATFAMEQFDDSWIAVAFAGLLLAAVLIVANNARALCAVAHMFDRWHFGAMAELVRTLSAGLADARRWANWRDLTVSLGMGLAAWGIVAGSFCWLLVQLRVDVPLLTGLAIYPLSMLVGAASMLPGGLGSTEATITALLVLNKAPLEVALLAAVAARLSSLWAAIVVGLVSLVLSESARRRDEELAEPAGPP